MSIDKEDTKQVPSYSDIQKKVFPAILKIEKYISHNLLISKNKLDFMEAIKHYLKLKDLDFSLVDKAFTIKHGKNMEEYIDFLISSKPPIQEAVYRFPDKLVRVVDGIKKNFIDATDIKNPIAAHNLINTIRDAVKRNGYEYEPIDQTFKTRYGKSIEDYIMADKRLPVYENSLLEGIGHTTAARCRNSLSRFIKHLTDSSNIVPLSNFSESYAEKDQISLKLNINGSQKKLESIKEKLTEQLISEGWMNKGDKFIKGSVKDGSMITLHPIKKTYHSKSNKENLALPIEIIGSKKLKKNIE